MNALVSDCRVLSFAPNDDGNCERFVYAADGKMLFDRTRGAWALWRGHKWEFDRRGREIQIYKDLTRALAEREMQAALANAGDDTKAAEKVRNYYLSLYNTPKIKNALEQAKSKLGVESADFDDPKGFKWARTYVNTPFGVWLFDGGQAGIFPHNAKAEDFSDNENFKGREKEMSDTHNKGDRHFMLTKSTAAGKRFVFPPKDGYNCPVWEKCIGDWTGGNKELAHYLQKAVGYSITTLTCEKCYFYLYGAGDNGKSAFVYVLNEIFGDYSVSINAVALAPSKMGGTVNNDEIADLNGARAAFVHEQDKVKLSSAMIKMLTGDGDTIKATRKFERPVEFIPKCKLWITSNEPFSMRDTSNGAWSRPRIIEFADIPPEKRDKGLKDKLKAEYEDIFLWIIQGLEMYLVEGLEPPECVKSAVETARADCDVIGQFLSDHTDKADGAVVSAKELHAAYKSWAENNGEFVESSTAFGNELKKRGFVKKRMKKGNFYIGIALT